MNQPVYEVVWPLGRSTYDIASPTQSVTDLSGKTVCQLWDDLFRGDEMFAVVREQLSKQYPGIKFVDHSVFGNTHGAKETEVMAALPGLLKKHGCDAVISGVGA